MPKGKPARPAPGEPDRTREMAIRRTAARQGYDARKIRRYDAAAPDFGRWLLTVAGSSRLVPGGSHKVRGIETGMSADEAEAFLGIASAEPSDQSDQPG